MSEKKNAATRDKNGRFVKGNTIGSETRFEQENDAALKYKPIYAKKLLDYFSREDIFPTFEGFADSIGVETDTLRNWCEQDARFRHCYERAKQKDCARVISGGLMKKYDPGFARFYLECCLGFGKKTEEEQGEKKPIDVNINIIPNPGAGAECSVQGEQPPHPSPAVTPSPAVGRQESEEKKDG